MALRPGHRGALIVMGLAYLQRGERLSRAQTMLEEAIAQGSGDPETHTVLGRIYLRRGMTEQARRAFHTAIALDPDYLGASYALARAYRSEEEFDAAIGIYSGIIDRWPDDFEAHYRAGELLKYRSDQVAFQLLRDREVAAPPEISPRQWRRQLATLKRQSIEYGQRALSFLETARRLQPQHLDSVRQLCDLHRRFARLTQARDCFAQLTQREPMEWLYPYRLGTILIELGAYDDAARSLQVAREMAPIVGDVYLALGLAYIRAERVDEAIAALEQGRMYEAFNPALYTNLGAAYATRGQLELARGALERSLDLSTFPLPRLHLTYTNLALVYWRQGERDETTQALKNALHVYPGYAYAQRLLEEVRLEEVQLEEVQSRTQATALDAPRPFVFNGSLERFGLVTTVAFGSE
jgi:tetratricopeptide (TPR) repeat protein